MQSECHSYISNHNLLLYGLDAPLQSCLEEGRQHVANLANSIKLITTTELVSLHVQFQDVMVNLTWALGERCDTHCIRSGYCCDLAAFRGDPPDHPKSRGING